MARLAHQALPVIAELFPLDRSSVDFNSRSLDYTPLWTTTSGLRYSDWTALLCSSKRLRANTRRQPAQIECSSKGCNGNYGGNCMDHFSHRALPLSSIFRGLPLLHLCLPTGFCIGPKFGVCPGRTKFPICRLSSSALADLKGLPKRHWIGVLGLSSQKPQRRRASRDGNGNSEEAEEEDKETLEELAEEVDEAQGIGDNDSEPTGERQDADKQTSPIESGKDSGEDKTEDNERVAQSEESKTGFWRKIWEPGQKEEDVALDAEEEVLLKELESLSFNWKALLEPSWDNVLALCFTALLTIALFKILFQLVLVVITILLSALKYTFVAAVLLGLLIFLL